MDNNGLGTERFKWDGHYIPDKNLFSAVCFARQLHELEGKTIIEALGIASSHYKIPISAIVLEIITDKYIKKNTL